MAPNGNGKLVGEFNFRNSTRRTFRFEQTNGEEIRTIYIAQSAALFKKGQPKKIRVTVEVIA
jgi:hypothetical protein